MVLGFSGGRGDGENGEITLNVVAAFSTDSWFHEYCTSNITLYY